MAELSKKELKQQKKMLKKKAKAQAKRRKKIQNKLDICLVALYFLVFLTAAVTEMIRNSRLGSKGAGRK